MGDVRWFLVAVVAILTLERVRCSPRIAHSKYVYRFFSTGGDICIYASFEMSFNIYYNSTSPSNEPSYNTIHLPDNTKVNVTGDCNGSHPEMTLQWENNTSLQMTFEKAHGKWELQQLTLVFNMSASISDLAEDKGFQTFLTNGSDLFSRTFKTNQYFYCKNCKTYEFGQYNESTCGMHCQTPCVKDTYCSSVHMKKSVIYVGGDPSNANKRLCLEDYIELQELIVPIAVGGVLALLLVLIFVSYIIAYVRRRRREAKSQYEPVGDF